MSGFLSEQALAPDPRIILVAEDEDMVRLVLTRVLSNAGYRTLEARNGEEAWQMAIFAHPYLHLVITDVVMPKLDGRTLGHRLNERLPSLPVLYISAHPIDDLFHRGAPNPSAPFLQKPILEDELLSLVQRLLEPAKQQSAASS
ncbi:MAG TPA: response regulator [Gemmatimonadales bacterium]|nr:response regulator [Gemmatimonadales bacterium]